ncbi:MAG: ABC transporter ATP-binding protein [Candidatus Kariarchaeaceae archaeon]|jgi:ABC-type sugar transport system ATPase subunit
MKITLQNITVSYENSPVLDDLEMSFPSGKLSVLLGRSGSGKTTILRTIAGLQYLDNGTIYFDAEDVTDRKPQKRGIGWVPQQQLLFPHMTVEKNLGYGIPRDISAANRTTRVAEVAELVGISRMLDRMPATLSGGERQRVALGRALAPKPKVLLLDEPFSSLDAPERDRLSFVFRDVQLNTGITTVFVTHALREAELLADTVSILHNGRILQSGTILDLHQHPNSAEVARLLDLTNFVDESQDLGILSPSLIPSEAIEIGSGSIEARIISVTRDRVYLKIGDTVLETINRGELKPGTTIKMNLNTSLIQQL